MRTIVQYTISLAIGILLLVLTSCSKEDITEGIIDCQCEKETYEIGHRVVSFNGVMSIQSTRKTISKEIVPCQEEQLGSSLGNNLYFNINCY
tara:strand:- start:1256 stop:1531 length:276 start_codon:yes stop_codon:yes gene_type:complete